MGEVILSLLSLSGTTGSPKGVMCSQDHLVWASYKYKDYGDLIMGQEVLLSYLPLSHLAAHLTDIYITTVCAGTVYFAQPDALKGTLLQTLLEVSYN